MVYEGFRSKFEGFGAIFEKPQTGIGARLKPGANRFFAPVGAWRGRAGIRPGADAPIRIAGWPECAAR